MDLHETIIKVRGYHLDHLGHVNNARYLEFLEEARWSYYEDQPGIAGLANKDMGIVIVNININYRVPAVLGDTLKITTNIKSTGKRSMVHGQTIYLNDSDKVSVDADITVVVIDLQTQKAIPIEGELREVLTGLKE